MCRLQLNRSVLIKEFFICIIDEFCERIYFIRHSKGQNHIKTSLSSAKNVHTIDGNLYILALDGVCVCLLGSLLIENKTIVA